MYGHKKTRSSRWLRSFVLVEALILLSACVSETQGQQPARPSARDTVREIQRKEMDRQLLLAPLPSRQTKSDRLLALKQIKEDFRDIQDVNNTMMANAWSREELDYFYISDKVSQIRAKAVRLKTNLSLPEARDVEKKQLDSVLSGVKEFRAALLLLDQSIMSFVTNPLFQKTNVVEVGPATRASHDLEVVIKLSGKLQKAAATFNRKPKEIH